MLFDNFQLQHMTTKPLIVKLINKVQLFAFYTKKINKISDIEIKINLISIMMPIIIISFKIRITPTIDNIEIRNYLIPPKMHMQIYDSNLISFIQCNEIFSGSYLFSHNKFSITFILNPPTDLILIIL